MSNKQTLDDIKYKIACGELTAPEVYTKMLQIIDKLQDGTNKCELYGICTEEDERCSRGWWCSDCK